MNTLKIDWDGCKSTDGLMERLERVRFVLGKVLRISDSYTLWYEGSPSGSGYHCIVRIKGCRLTNSEICLLQALCGSDLYRETFNFARIRRGVEEWNILFKGRREPL